MDSVLNRHMTIFQLHELQDHINDLIEEIDTGHYDEDSGDLSYPIALDHLMDHLVLAWHYSKMSDEKIASLSQDRRERLMYAIPKFNVLGEYRLVELYEDV